MPMRLSIEDAEPVADDIWKASLDPSEIRRLGDCQNAYGDLSVVLLTGPVSSEGASRLEFDPRHARLLNVGATSDTVILASTSGETEQTGERGQLATGARMRMSATGDSRFLDSLPPEIQALGEKLLSGVRRHFPGELKYRQPSGKYVESPDNFWTVKIQPRDKSLRVTVRGVPEAFQVSGEIVLKPDMGSYSAFKISRLEQLTAAISVIRRASQI